MNYIFDIKVGKYKNAASTLPMNYFFVKFNIDENEKRRKSRKVEELIQKYSLSLYLKYQKPKNENKLDDEDENDEYLLLRSDFDDLINDISCIYLSKNYLGLYSWLLDRAFNMTKRVSVQKNNSNLNKNKSILLKVLYDINKDNLLKVFKKQ